MTTITIYDINIQVYHDKKTNINLMADKKLGIPRKLMIEQHKHN